MATTELSVSATPGKPHQFSPKALAVVFYPDLELSLGLKRSVGFTLSVQRSVDLSLDIDRSLDFTLDLTND